MGDADDNRLKGLGWLHRTASPFNLAERVDPAFIFFSSDGKRERKVRRVDQDNGLFFIFPRWSSFRWGVRGKVNAKELRDSFPTLFLSKFTYSPASESK